MGAQDIPDQPVSTVFRIAVLLILSGVILLLTPVSTFAQDINNTMLQRVERVTARPLPTLSSLLGQEPSLPAAPTMVIGLLENSNATNPDDWGRAIGWFLMDAAYTAYHELAIVPPYQFHSDARPDTDNDDSSRREQLSRVAARVGARFGLTGIIGVENGRFDLILELLEYPSNRRILIQQKSGELEDISITVQTLAQAIFAEAVAIANPTGRLIAGTITSPEVGELQALAATFGKTRSLPQEERLLAYQKLWQEDPQLGPNALIYLGMLIYSGNTDLIRTNLDQILTKCPSSIALQTYGQLLQVQYSLNRINLAAQVRLKELLRINPNNLGAWLALTDTYLSEPVLANTSNPIDHHMGYASAIALAIETARRWPKHYRSWWALGSSLHEYAWLVRGSKFWSEVPEDNRNRYRAMMTLADEYITKAVRSHPNQGQLHANMISIDKAMGRDWRSSFYRAVKLDPNVERHYRVAFCYSRPQWGGTKEDRSEVYWIAKKNNPDADWPRQLRNTFAPDIKPFIDFDEPWVKRGLLAALLLSGLSLAWGYWSHRRGR